MWYFVWGALACCPFVVRLLSDCCPIIDRTTIGQQSDNERTTNGVGLSKILIMNVRFAVRKLCGNIPSVVLFSRQDKKKDAEASFLLCVFQRCICRGVIESIGEVVEEVSALLDCSVKVYASACGIAFCRVWGLVDGLVGELLGCHLFDLSGPVGVVVQQFVHTSDAFGALFELYVV